MRGQTLVELLLVIGLSAIILPALLTGLVAGRSGKAQQSQRLEAVTILKETEEALRNVRENDWNTFAAYQSICPCHPEVSGSSWILDAGTETINGFTRSVAISDVERDASGAIVSSAGTIDPSSKKLVITVSWDTPLPSSIESTIYLMRLDNITYTETTEAEFDNGTGTAIAVTNTSGGEIILGGGGQGNWCEPGDSILEELNYPGTAEARAITAIEGRAFTGTGANASGLPFANIAISNTNPPIASIIDTYTNVSPPKTNDVFGEEDYAYIATDENNGEIIIIDLTTTPYSRIGEFNPSGNNKGMNVFVVGNVGYMTTFVGNKFRTFDLTSKTGFRPQHGQVELAGIGNSIYIKGNYAYVTTSSSSTQLHIIDVLNPASPQIVGSVSLTNVGGRDVYVNDTGTRAYVVTANSAGNPEFFIIDITDKENPFVIPGGTYDTGAMSPTGIRVVPGNRALVVGESAGERYQVLDIGDESAPVRCGGMDINVDVYGIDAVLEEDGDAYSYIVTADANAEFKIIEGGPGGQFASDGTFESQTIPIPMPIDDTSFNRFEVNVNRPSQADIRFQVAVEQAIAGSCSGVTFNFVGNDGTNSTFFDTAVTTGTESFDYAIPTAINPGQCFRYKIFLSTLDSTQTPTFYDITINYAP